MTGRELIIYILENNLEDENIVKDGIFMGLITVQKAAVKFDTGEATIRAWYDCGILNGVKINNEIFIFSNSKLKIEGGV